MIQDTLGTHESLSNITSPKSGLNLHEGYAKTSSSIYVWGASSLAQCKTTLTAIFTLTCQNINKVFKQRWSTNTFFYRIIKQHSAKTRSERFSNVWENANVTCIKLRKKGFAFKFFLKLYSFKNKYNTKLTNNHLDSGHIGHRTHYLTVE